ncbi:MAG: MarR family winged helix-turn-helix transcriptional regulator [Acidimicrobiales bacterium]
MSDAESLRVAPELEKDWPGASAIATEVVLNVVRTGETVTALLDSLVRHHGLPSATGLLVLEILRGEGGPLAPSVIAQRGFVSRPALSGVMNTLERRGFLRRYTDPRDRRRVLVELIDHGMDTMLALLPELHRAEVEWTAALSDTQKASLLRHLGRLQRHLTRDAPNRPDPVGEA